MKIAIHITVLNLAPYAVTNHSQLVVQPTTNTHAVSLHMVASHASDM